MDIWAWVRASTRELSSSGHARLAELLMQIPDATCDDRHAEVDALVPEALALARATKNPWIEMFVRHWSLQSRVLHRHEVSDCLPEAVSLLEFASRPGARDCPQSVCVTQDLACCYGDKDGPGYAAERLAVARETLARIDPTWPCFDCISSEYVAALIDDDRAAEALPFIERQRAALAEQGELELGSNLTRDLADVLLLLGRPKEALAELDAWDTDGIGAHAELEKQLVRVRAYLALDRPESALEVFVPVEAVLKTAGLYQRWMSAALGLVRSKQLDNDWKLGRAFGLLQSKLERNGALYLAASSALDAAELALERRAKISLGYCLARARKMLDRLRRTELLRSRIEGLTAELSALGPRSADPLPETSELVLEEPFDDPEIVLERLELARERFSDSIPLARKQAAALRALAFETEAEELLRNCLCSHPRAAELLNDLGQLLLDCGKHASVGELTAPLLASQDADDECVAVALWLEAKRSELDGRLRDCRDRLRELVRHRPRAINARHALARIERGLKNYAGALEVLDELSAVLEPGGVDWDRMVAATLAGRWDAVRDSARRLGLEIEGEGPIDVAAGPCRLELEDERGQPVRYFAERRGPVTARIIEIAGPSASERFGDLWVFDATPLDSSKSGEASDEDSLPTYRALERIDQGSYRSFALDGVHPGEEALAELRRRLNERGAVLQVQSGANYLVHVEGSVVEPGCYAFVAAPASMSLVELSELLSRATHGFAHPLLWLELAEAIGDEREIARQREIAERYSL